MQFYGKKNKEEKKFKQDIIKYKSLDVMVKTLVYLLEILVRTLASASFEE